MWTHGILSYLLIIPGIVQVFSQDFTEDQSRVFMEINTAHLDHLYEEIVLSTGDSVGIIHIYAEYPDYNHVGDADEGIACIDDAARAAIFYLRHFEHTGHAESMRKGRMLIGFTLAMQAENGYFHNFIWPDHSIHRTGKTTLAEPNWWSWRCLWLFGEALSILQKNDPLVKRIRKGREQLIRNILRDFKPGDKSLSKGGIDIPAWLPNDGAGDQTALILLGLTALYQETEDPRIRDLMHALAQGIMTMQVDARGTFPHGAFLSWQNLWHAYGNSQAYALLKAGQVLAHRPMIRSALTELDHFIPALLDKKGLHHFYVEKEGSKIDVVGETRFPQIAYDYRPVVWACLEAWKITKERKYHDLAIRTTNWLSGNNIAGARIYDQKTGRCFDGIISPSEINKNSGAESTIEALLMLVALQQ